MESDSPTFTPLDLNLPLEHSALVYRWDLDKTYLRTEFDTARDMFWRLFERPSQKRTVPGAAALLRELQATDPAGVYILSGSPEQMRKVLEAKLRLDGVRWDGFVLKPSLKNLLRGHFGFLRDQVGFKIGAMLASREGLSPGFTEVLFGDDAETDAFNYSLYADLCAGRVGAEMFNRVLEQAAVTEEETARLVQLAERLPRREACARIFIHLDRMSALDRFEPYGNRVCPFYNYFQPAVVLVEMGAIGPKAALRVAADLVIDQGFTPEALAASYLELARRGQVGGGPAQMMREALDLAGTDGFATATPVLQAFGREMAQASLRAAALPLEAGVLDYEEALAQERKTAKAEKLRAMGRY